MALSGKRIRSAVPACKILQLWFQLTLKQKKILEGVYSEHALTFPPVILETMLCYHYFHLVLGVVNDVGVIMNKGGCRTTLYMALVHLWICASARSPGINPAWLPAWGGFSTSAVQGSSPVLPFCLIAQG